MTAANLGSSPPDRSGVVLVVGATGAVGRQVVASLLARGRTVRALVRPGSDASGLEALGVQIARGDLMDAGSLLAAMAGVDAVITTAAGYTKRRDTDSDETDTLGNRNLVDAAKTAKIRRFVLCSILTADQTPNVPHFWHKKLAEDYLLQQQVPFVALRPGAFLDQSVDFIADRVAKGRLLAIGSPDVPVTYVYTLDLARYLAEAVDLPEAADGSRIDIGWDRPVSWRDLRDIVARLRGVPLAMSVLPWWLLGPLLSVIGLFSASVRDVREMLAFFQTGRYVADTTLQARYFDVPTAEDVLGRWLRARELGPAGGPQ